MNSVFLSVSGVLDNFVNTLISLCTSFGFKLLWAILILVIGLKVVKWVVKLISKTKLFQSMDISVSKFLQNAIKIVLNVVIIMSAAIQLGVPAASFITVLSSCALAVGLALQGSLSNLAGSIMILIFKPFSVGDFIEAGGMSGTVNAINFFYTVLYTADNKVITMPNGALSNGNIINYSRLDYRRVDFTFSVGYASDIEKVKNILLDCANAHELVLEEPAAPMARLTKHGESSLDFVLRVWCKSSDYWTVNFDLIESVKEAFDKAGIEIPFPQMDVHMKGN